MIMQPACNNYEYILTHSANDKAQGSSSSGKGGSNSQTNWFFSSIYSQYSAAHCIATAATATATTATAAAWTLSLSARDVSCNCSNIFITRRRVVSRRRRGQFAGTWNGILFCRVSVVRMHSHNSQHSLALAQLSNQEINLQVLLTRLIHLHLVCRMPQRVPLLNHFRCSTPPLHPSSTQLTST